MGVPVWWERQNPRKVIQPGSSPGQCWAFKGTAGNVVIKLSNPVYVSDITLEHIPKSLSPDGNIASAPKHFEVVGNILISNFFSAIIFRIHDRTRNAQILDSILLHIKEIFHSYWNF